MNLFKLVNMQIRLGFGLSALAWYGRNRDRRLWGIIGIALLVLIGIAPIFFLYLKLIQTAYQATVTLGQTEVVLASSLVFSSYIVLLLGGVYIMSAFYFSRDLSFLMPLPLLPRDILASKFVVVLISNYLTIAPFFIPALLVYGLNSAQSVFYWLGGIIVFLLAPMIPLAVSSAAVIVLMRLTNIVRRKDTVRIISMLLLLLIVMVFNFMITRIPPGQELEFIEGIISGQENLVRFISKPYPPAAWATRALTAGGSASLANMLAFAGLSFAGLAVVLMLGDRLFYHGLIGGEEVGTRKKLSAGALDKALSREGSPVAAIASREIKILFRTPIYMFNSVAMLLILPVILIIPTLSQGGVNALLAQVNALAGGPLLNLGAAAVIGALSLFTPASSSAFSREGKNFWVSQVIPVHPATQIRGKILYSFIITLLTVPFLLAFSLIASAWTALELLIIILLGAAISFPAITVALLIDLLRPYLNWDNPQKAIKQNINVLLSMVAGAAIFYVIFLAGRIAYLNGADDITLYLTVLVTSVVCGLIPYLIMVRIAALRYSSISS